MPSVCEECGRKATPIEFDDQSAAGVQRGKAAAGQAKKADVKPGTAATVEG
jgi:hypothetical protein